MKSETKIWLDYAEENLKSSKILLDNKLYNPSLQNVQQSVEKALKAIVVAVSFLSACKDKILHVTSSQCFETHLPFI
jgi:hypothetical protein